MSTAELLAKFPTPTFPPDEILVAEDGVPLESDWHRIEISLLVELVGRQFAGRDDYFAGGNMFIYFNEQQARNRDFRGPDFFFVWGVSPMPLRPYWAVWKEGGRYPDVIIELLSPATEGVDRTIKKDVYEKTFRTDEYFLYDPESRRLDGYRLDRGKYEPLVPNKRGWLWSEQLQLWLGLWKGVYLMREAIWLRFYTKDGILVPTIEEFRVDQIALAEQRAATAEEKAATAEEKAAEERRRAEAAEAELAHLKAQLAGRKDDTA